jgi:hypothetical protein
MVASRCKVSLDQMATPVPEIMDGSLYTSIPIHLHGIVLNYLSRDTDLLFFMS